MAKIIYTITAYDTRDEPHKIPWETALNSPSHSKISEKENVIILKIDDTRFFIITNEGADESIDEKVDIFREALDSLQLEKEKPPEVYCAIHETRDYESLTDSITDELKTYNCKLDHCKFSHTFDKEPFETIKKLLEAIEAQKEDAAEKFDRLCDIIKKKTLIPDFAILRHRISHLWLPLYLDLKQIIKITDIKQRQEYARQVIEEYRECQDPKKQNHSFRQLLADCNFMATGEQTTGKIKTSLSSDILPGEKSLTDILKEAGLENNELETFIKHAPLKKFLESLDKANTPDKFLDIIDKGVNSFNAREFNDQVSKLDKNLAELENQLKEKLGGTW